MFLKLVNKKNMKISQSIEYTDRYFLGFQDISNFHEPKKVLEGVFKIISYFTILIPFIFKFYNRKFKKIDNIYKKLDENLLNRNEISKQGCFVDHKVSSDIAIGYLMEKLQNIRENGIEKEGEVRRFQNGFRELSFLHQGEFFEKLMYNRLFEEGMKLIPRDISLLFFKAVRMRGRFDETRKYTEIFLNSLKEFSKLHIWDLNLSELDTVDYHLIYKARDDVAKLFCQKEFSIYSETWSRNRFTFTIQEKDRPYYWITLGRWDIPSQKASIVK